MNALPKSHLSHSQVNMFLRCPKQYEFRYFENIIAPPSGMLILGSSGHSALAYNFTQKIDSHKDLKANEICDYFASEFDKRVQEEQPIFEPDLSRGNLKDGGVSVIKKYRSDFSGSIQPVEVEKEFNIEFENVEYTLNGYIDLIDDRGLIRDHKFSRKTPSQSDIDDDLQATVYYMAYKYDYDCEPKGFEYDYLINKKNPEIKPYPTSRSEADIEEYLGILGDISNAIKAGNFYKNTQGWHCSPQYCGYFAQCRPHRLSKIFI